MSEQSFYEYNSSKEYLARLIATENINIVRSPDFATASFDPKTRTMYMPIWKTSEEVYDLLTIHEMAHALYTPADGWHTAVVNDPNLKGYLNIIEDARIEKTIKRRFAGASNTFREGYGRLNQDDFFGIKKHNVDVNTASLIDRINIYYKLGSLVHVPFNDEERDWLFKIDQAETWEDVERIARELYAYAKEQAQTNETEMLMQEVSGGAKESKGSGDGIESDDEDPNEATGKDASVDGISSVTDKEYRERMFNLENNAAQKGNKDQFMKVGNVNLKDWVIPAKLSHAVLNRAFSNLTSGINIATNEMMAQQTVIVNTMVKEFESKKRATSYARNQYSKSGRLDMKKLSKYQLADDIFRRNVIEHKGKNHSMVMIVDWSGSMSNQLIDTVIQTINLAMFCRKVGIPFSVQIFANRIPSFSTGKPQEQDGDYGVHNNVTMFEMLSSESTASEFKQHVANFYAIAVYEGANYWDSDMQSKYNWLPRDSVIRDGDFGSFHLNGTPLNAALFITSEYVKQFRAKHKSEVTNVIVLTDGESGSNRNLWWGNSYHIFDPKTGVTYRTAHDRNFETHLGFDLIRDRNHGRVNIIGYYISDTRSVLNTARQWSGDWATKLKNGFAVINKTKTFRADRFFLVSNKNIVVNDEWDFDFDDYVVGGKEQEYDPTAPVPPKKQKVIKNEEAIVKEIKKSFASHSQSKRDNRVILSKFIDDIAAKIV